MMKIHSLFVVLFLCILWGCNQEPIGQQPIDKTIPGVVTDVKVENIPGGAILTYSVPQDQDLLYVKAVYSLKDGVKSEARASLYNDTLKVAGFGDTQERQVSVVAVDRSRNESAPVNVTIKPLTPPVLSVGETLNLVADFGGVHAYWSNPLKAELAVILMKEDRNKEYVPIQSFYSAMAAGDAARRGMDTIPAKFAVFVQDRWENKSPVKYFTLTPIFETKFDRLKFREVSLPNDVKAAWGWVMPRIWDDVIGDQGFHTANGSGIWPQSFTFDLGVTGRISRIVEWQRQGSWIYMHGNIRNFEVWGCATLDPTGNWSSWTKLMDCESIKPSGLPVGQTSSADVAWASAGEEFISSPMNPKVRYLRFKVTRSWSDGDFFHLSEVRVFGDNR